MEGHYTHHLVLVAECSNQLANVAAPACGLHELDFVCNTLRGRGNVDAFNRNKYTPSLLKGWGILGFGRGGARRSSCQKGIICVGLGRIPFLVVVLAKIEVYGFVDG